MVFWHTHTHTHPTPRGAYLWTYYPGKVCFSESNDDMLRFQLNFSGFYAKLRELNMWISIEKHVFQLKCPFRPPGVSGYFIPACENGICFEEQLICFHLNMIPVIIIQYCTGQIKFCLKIYVFFSQKMIFDPLGCLSMDFPLDKLCFSESNKICFNFNWTFVGFMPNWEN